MAVKNVTVMLLLLWKQSELPPQRSDPGFHAAGFQNGPDHRHESARLIPAEPRRILCAGRPVEAGVGKGRPGPCQPPVNPTACRQVGQTP